MNYLKSYIKAIKWIISIVTFKEEKISEISYKDEFYEGLNGEQTEVRVFYSNKKTNQSVILFPGASPYAENHPAMIMLGNALRNVGYNVFLPRVPTLKNLLLVKENVDWFSHCYEKLLEHSSVCKENVMVVGISYGGANLLKASLSDIMQKYKPKSYLSYGTYYSINTALNFFLTGKISYNNQEYHITPHEWGMIVLFYNFIDTIKSKYDQKTIKKLLKYRIEDNDNMVNEIRETLSKENQILVDHILKGEINSEIEQLVHEIIETNSELLNYLSPENWAHNINDKIFIFHGANDSMVPFTESNLLAKQLKNSELLISFVFEHREISTNRGFIFKIKELIKMIKFFAAYFRFNQ
mgnify:FL=1